MRDGHGKSEKLVKEFLEIYEGLWEKDKKCGKGILKNKDGRYEGDFKNDLREGKGLFLWNNGDKFEGDWI